MLGRLMSARHATIRWVALLLLCGAYLQGAIDKAIDFDSAIAEMRHFGLAPAGPIAVLVIAAEIGASALILFGVLRWAGAAFLGAFTLAATLVALRFWELQGPGRVMAENAFFEHLGLVGGFVLVALDDLREKVGGK
jgi:uncharacterized membrane protein YphA (DoxX/SURF4 family)